MVRAADAAWCALPTGSTDAECDDVGEEEWESYINLFAVAPTTIEGFAALFSYLGEDAGGVSRFRAIVDNWSGGVSDQVEHPDEMAWLAMLSSAIKRAR